MTSGAPWSARATARAAGASSSTTASSSALLIAVYFGGKLAISELDKAPKHNPAVAPWAKPGPEQQQRAPQQFQ